MLLKCLLTSSSQLCLISFSAHSSLTAPLWFCLPYYFLPQDLDTCSSPRLKRLALPYSHSHLQAYFRSSIYQILPWISHHGLWCTEHLFCSPCPVDWLIDWLICGIKILSFLLPKDGSHICLIIPILSEHNNVTGTKNLFIYFKLCIYTLLNINTVKHKD